MKKNIYLGFLLLGIQTTFAQYNHCKPNHIAVGAMKSIGDPGYMVHTHFQRSLMVTGNKLAVGLGAMWMSEHEQYGFSVPVSYSPVPNVAITLSPSLVKHHTAWEFAGSADLRYDISLGNFHLSPMIGYNIGGHGNVPTAGLHFGFGF